MNAVVWSVDQEIRQEARREARCRRELAKRGYALHKSRVRTWNYDNQGEYMITDPDSNAVVAGERFDMTIDDVEEWLAT